MTTKLFPLDTIARRLATMIATAILLMFALVALFLTFGGDWARPPIERTGLLGRAAAVVRMMDTVPAVQRRDMADAAEDETLAIRWYPQASAVAAMLDGASTTEQSDDLGRVLSLAGHRKAIHLGPNTPALSFDEMPYNRDEYPSAEFLGVGLNDASWVVFAVPTRLWGLGRSARIAIGMSSLVISIGVVSAVAAHRMGHPIGKFTRAFSRFGADLRAAPMKEFGPQELRATIGAFNAMQTQIEKFVDDRTAMLAAISHDLRTPLTRMRLRGEFIQDEGQRARLFRDVEEMQAMVEASLSFFRDDYKAEQTTTFDIPQLLLMIIDDYSDQGIDVGYDGPTHIAFRGRPFALKRAFHNLIDNAIRYGEHCEVELRCEQGSASVLIRDSGPGIPSESLEQVFAPFHRLERSRNRATGGVGLGLTSARAVITGHGGRIKLSNRATRGLEVEVLLPQAA